MRNGENGRRGLLEELAYQSGFIYLSDLHGRWPDGDLLKILEQIMPEDYGVEEWSEAIHYICGLDMDCADQEEARAFLSGCLSGSLRQN